MRGKEERREVRGGEGGGGREGGRGGRDNLYKWVQVSVGWEKNRKHGHPINQRNLRAYSPRYSIPPLRLPSTRNEPYRRA